MGAYCQFCGRRCFVVRVVPDGPWEGWSGCMATCAAGMEHDRKMLGGYDHRTSSNPYNGSIEAALAPSVPSGEETP